MFGCRWPGLLLLANRCGEFLGACLLVLVMESFCMHYLSVLCFFSCIVTVILGLAITKLVLYFFCLLKFASCIRFGYAWCIIVCLLFCLLVRILGLHVHLPACLIFWNACVHCLFVFFLKIAHIYIFCFFADSCRHYLLAFRRFFAAVPSASLLWRRIINNALFAVFFL